MHQSNEPLIVGIKGSFDNQNFQFIPNLSNFKVVENLKDPLVKSADGFMQTNILKPKLNHLKDQYDFIKESGKPFLVYESPCFRKNCSWIGGENYMQRVGWNHFMRQGIFCNKNSPSDRFEKIAKDQEIKILPWRKSGEYILFICQKPGDSSLENVYSKYEHYTDYIIDCVKQIRKHSDRKILLRGHPRSNKSRMIAESRTNGGTGLARDFENAWCVIGTTSNTLIESACLGIPTFALDESSMAYDISQPDLSYIENPKLDIERMQWLYDLAYTQWYTEEHQTGKVWDRLKSVYFS
jgi:hypothetical protein